MSTTPWMTVVERFLVDPNGPDAAGYEIRGGIARAVAFFTGGVNGKSADDTAIANLADASAYLDGPLTLRRLPAYPSSRDAETLAYAYGGLVRLAASGPFES